MFKLSMSLIFLIGLMESDVLFFISKRLPIEKPILLFACLLAFSFPAFAEDIGVSDDFLERFSSLPSYSQAKISPDGKVISVIFKIDEKDTGIKKFKMKIPKLFRFNFLSAILIDSAKFTIS